MPLLGSNNNLDVSISTSADTSGIKQTQEQIQSLNDTAEESSNKVGGLSGIFDNFGSTLKAVAQTFISYQLVSQTEQFFSSIISSAGGLEQTSIAFQSMIGNAKDANSVFGQLVQYANTTPFQAADIENAARTLMSFGTEGQQTVDLIKKIGDVSAIGGANIQDLARISGQIFSSGKFDAREFLELIRDGGAGIIKVMAENSGGMANLRAEMDKGKVSSQVFFDALNQATSQNGFAFHGAQREAETLNGRLSTLRDAATMAGLSLLGIKLDPQLGLQIQPGGLFDQMKGGISDVTNTLNGLQPVLARIVPQFIDSIRQMWDKVANFLGPSLAALWKTISTQLIPALENFWHQVIQPLIPLIGTALVLALWATVNVLDALLKIITPVLNFMADHTWVVQTLTGAFLALKGAMMLQAAFTAIQSGVALLTGTVFPSMLASISTVGAAWLAAFPVAGIIADIMLVYKAIETVQGAFNALNQAANAKVSAADQAGTIKDIEAKYNAGKINKTQETNAINAILKGVDAVSKHATGGFNLSGGLSLVGESGPELVDLPHGSSVYTNAQSNAMMRGVTNTRTVHIGQIVLATPAAASQFFKNLDQDTLNVSSGLTPVQGRY
jgi:hypothetical protein